MHAFYSDLEDLRSHFYERKCPKWNLYHGFQTGNYKGSEMATQQPNDISYEESWDLLERTLSAYQRSGLPAKLTLYLKTNSNNTGERLKIYLNPSGVNQPGINGVQSQNLVPVDEVDRRINQAIHIERLERNIEDLQAAIEDKQSSWERFADRLLEDIDVNQVAGLLISKFSGRGAVPMTQVSGQVAPNEEVVVDLNDPDLQSFLVNVRSNCTSDEQFKKMLKMAEAYFAANSEDLKGSTNG